MYAGSEKDLLQSADLAILLTASKANGGIGGQVRGLVLWVNSNFFKMKTNQFNLRNRDSD